MPSCGTEEVEGRFPNALGHHHRPKKIRFFGWASGAEVKAGRIVKRLNLRYG